MELSRRIKQIYGKLKMSIIQADNELDSIYGKRVQQVHQRVYDRVKNCTKQLTIDECMYKVKDIYFKVDLETPKLNLYKCVDAQSRDMNADVDSVISSCIGTFKAEITRQVEAQFLRIDKL